MWQRTFLGLQAPRSDSLLAACGGGPAVLVGYSVKSSLLVME